MNFRVGEYVRYEDEIGKVVHIYGKSNPNWIGVMFHLGGIDDTRKDSLIKLNIRFKHFNIVLKSDGEREVWDSMRKIRGFGRVYFTCMEEDNYIFIGYKIPNKRIVSTHVQTVEQAEAWLSLQHARTLIESKEATK